MMIGLLVFSDPKDEQPSSSVRLQKAAQELGHTMVVLYEPYLSFYFDGKKLGVTHEGLPLPAVDVILARPNFIEEPSLHTSTFRLLSRAGYRLINGNPEGVTLSKNKLEQHVRFLEADIPMPKWTIARGTQLVEAAAQTLGYPVIIKVPFGTCGKGVFFAPNSESLLPIADYLDVRDECPVIVEEFITEADTKDVRVFVVGNKIVAAMERVARTGDVRANAAQGGEGRKTELSDGEQALALKATTTAGLDIAGVDILRSSRGPLVIEINANPGFNELERATGIDIALAIVSFCASITE